MEVEREFVFNRYGKGQKVLSLVKLWSSVAGGREGGKKRIDALSVVPFGDKPSVKSGGKALIYTKRRLEHAKRYKEIKEVAESWLARHGT